MRTPITSMRTAAQLPCCAASHSPASRRNRRTFSGVTAWATPPNWSLVRVFTSTNTTDAGRVVGRDHVQLAVSAPPIAGQHAQPKRRQMVNGQLLTKCADLGTGQRSHGATMRTRYLTTPTTGACGYPQSPIHPHDRCAHGFAAVKKRVYGAMVDKPLQGVADRATDSDAFEYAARAGFAVSGVLHRSRRVHHSRGSPSAPAATRDQSGALATLARPDRRRRDALGRRGRDWWRWVCGGSPKQSSVPNPASDPRQVRTTPSAWKRAKSLGLAIVNFAIALLRRTLRDGKRSTK